VASKFLQTLRLGFKSLLLHKLRSALAILGILIGVTAVIWLVAMGEGVSYQAQQQIKELGAKNIIVRNVKPPQNSSSNRGGFMSVLEYGLKRDDYKRIVRTVPTVLHAVPMREVYKEARYMDRTADVRLVACTSEYQELNNLRIEQGRFLADADKVNNVAVLGHQTARALFPYEDPIGKVIHIDQNVYVVIGQTAERAATGSIGGSFSGQDYNQDVYIPLETLRRRIGDTVVTSRSGSMEGETVQLSQITVTVHELEQVDETAGIIKAQLEKFHDIVDYSVIIPKELLQQAEVMQMMFNVLLVLIAGISLLVGGIGIMNIMLATVTERTREIGIRRALGAKQGDIVEQFLSEAVVLSAVGGLLGVLLGFLCTPSINFARWSMNVFFPDMMAALPANIQQLEPRIATWSVIASFFISVAVGVAFGLYPARRAAMMDPIEALRHE
jgi:putative ABC transport system permease protein